MDPAQAEEWRKRMESMTPEEREKLRERFGGGGGGSRGGTSGGSGN
jgi:hypothetical protein